MSTTIIMCWLLFWHSVAYPTGGDALVYGQDAAHLQTNSFTREMPSGGLRTYGYAWFLSIVFAGYEWDRAFGLFSPRTAIAQTALYLAASLWLFSVILPRSRTFAWCAIVGLLCNPFVLNYVPLRLTEGITASIAIALAACLVSLSRPSSSNRLAVVLLVGSLLAGFALMVRPANLSLFGAWVVAVAVLARRHKDYRATICIIGLIGLLLPLLPQLAINCGFHDKLSVFPPRDLGQFQTNLGLRNFKYMAVFTPDAAVPLHRVFYPSELFSSTEVAQGGTSLYLTSPIKGAILALGHVYQSINHDFFFTYNYHPNPWSNAPMNLFGHVILFFAGYAGWGLAIAGARQRACFPNPAIIFTIVAVTLTAMVNSVAMVETRFGMLIYLTAGPLAARSVAGLRSSQHRGLIIAAALLYGVAATVLSFAMLPNPVIP